MNYELLDELIATSKKNGVSKLKQKSYNEQMELLLNAEGLSETAEKYLKSGFRFNGAKPLAVYIQKSNADKRAEIISKVLKSGLVKGSDRVAAFKYSVHLSAYSIMWFENDQSLLIELIKLLPSVSKSKDGKLLKDAPKIFEKYFLDLLDDSVNFPDLGGTNLKDIFIREYRQMIVSILDNVSDKYETKVKRVYEWIGIPIPEKETIESINSTEGNKNLAFDQKNGTKIPNSKHNKKEESETINSYSKKELQNILSETSVFVDRMEVTLCEWDKTRDKLEKVQEELLNLSKKLQLTEMKYNEEIQKTKKQNEEIDNVKLQISNMQFSLNDSHKIIASRDSQIVELKTEIERLNSIISVYATDKKNSQAEQLNAIASKLKSEYRDFKDVEKEDMTLDLGENFRFQLQSIFKILIKAGIDIERR